MHQLWLPCDDMRQTLVDSAAIRAANALARAHAEAVRLERSRRAIRCKRERWQRLPLGEVFFEKTPRVRRKWRDGADPGPADAPPTLRSLRVSTPLSAAEKAFRPQALRILAEHEHERPKTRGDCLPGGCNEQRPCPWASCRHHLIGLDPITEGRRAGSLQMPHGHVDPSLLKESCALDVADQGRHQVQELVEIVGIQWERLRQIERWARQKIKRTGTALRGE